MTVRTITDFRELNKRIIRRLYPIPKISTTLQELEGFTYATALYLNMGYYTVRLDPNAVKMFTGDVHRHIFMGQVFVLKVTYGICRFSRHLPSRNDGSDGIPRVCESMH